MAKGRKTGGREKGTPNNKTLEVAAILEEVGWDPIRGMAKLAMNPRNTPELRGRMFSELAQYLHARRKAIEHTSPEGDTPFKSGLTDEQANRIDNLAPDELAIFLRVLGYIKTGEREQPLPETADHG
jgi:hypothetical protein